MAEKGYQYMKQGTVISLGSQTVATGSTSIQVTGTNKVLLGFLVASIGTNVVVRMEGSFDESDWVNLDDGGVDTIIIENGLYSFTFNDAGLFQFVRFYWVSTSVGSPTINVSGMVA